jgi:nicotinamidase/pyrazinamidase
MPAALNCPNRGDTMNIKNSALLIIDVQNDFCPGGALPVPEGDRVVEPLNRAAKLFATAKLPVVASRDWHPAVTSHFSAYGGIWPSHCIQGSRGAEFHPQLELPQGCLMISKGFETDADSYSAFDGRLPDGRNLQELLAGLGVARLYVGGLATDYCVKESVLAALKAGLQVVVLEDAIAGVEVTAGDSLRAIDEMKAAGAFLSTVSALANGI